MIELKQHSSSLYKQGTFRWHLEYLKNGGFKKHMIVVEIKETSFNDKNEFNKPHTKNNDYYEDSTILVFGMKNCFPLGLHNKLSRTAICCGRRYRDVTIDKKLVKYNNKNYEHPIIDENFNNLYYPTYFKINPKNVYYIDPDGNIEQITWSIDVINEKLNLNLKMEEIKMNTTENKIVAVAEATEMVTETMNNGIEIPAPVIATEETVVEKINDVVESESQTPTGGTVINNVADFLKFVNQQKAKPQGIADGRIKLSLNEVLERLDGVVPVQKIEQCTNEGRNFYVVQMSDKTYMYSFKMMTTIIGKLVEACGSVETLNDMLAQTDIKFKCIKSEYMGKSYTKAEIM